MTDESAMFVQNDSLPLFRRSVEAQTTATQKHYEWVKPMLSLSFAALTALVALQNNYKPDSDLPRYLLWTTFVSLACAVVASAIVLRGEGIAYRNLALQLVKKAQGYPPEETDTELFHRTWLCDVQKMQPFAEPSPMND